MAILKKRKKCRYCDRYVMAEMKAPNHGLHFALSVLSVVFLMGLWIPVWFILAIIPRRWYCQTCGGKC